MPRARTPLAKRLLSKFTVGDDCWVWSASFDRHGYGQVRSEDGHTLRAHRAVYELLIGPIPEGMHLDHLCRTPECVNPSHLEPVTHAENIRRGIAGQLLAKRNLSKTHCPQGHPYDEANTYVYVNGDGAKRRSCRTCHTARERIRRAVA